MKRAVLLFFILAALTEVSARFGKDRGVYIEELGNRGRSIQGVSTGVPVFIGYTAAAPARSGPLSVRSFDEYRSHFGGPAGHQARHALFESVKLFFDNGGKECFVISAGRYVPTVAYSQLHGALVLSRDVNASIICIPDAVYLAALDFKRIQGEILALCREKRDRFAILDTQEPTGSVTADAGSFRNGFMRDDASWGAAYYPWLVISGGKQVPPCGAIAGIYSKIDASRGVWKSPANVEVRGVTGPSVNLNSSQQNLLQTDAATGISINPIRAFPGKGLLLYGARTLAGNDNEWRYVSVRRLLIYLEQSITAGIRWTAFEPNEAKTWASVRAAVEQFLTQQWRNGALQGSRPEQAFFVRVGLGETMTAGDINSGRIIIEAGVAAVRPSEFIIVRIKIHMAAH